jgi:5-methylcytosine-specific restriction endonuclease McrA
MRPRRRARSRQAGSRARTGEITMKRTPISQSIRWAVFARDGFRCRYCGRQAGDPGVTLHADHVISVADGGTNAMDNLVAACQSCNGGKSARSLDEVPGSTEAIAFAEQRAASLRDQAEALKAQREAEDGLREEMVSLICSRYRVTSFHMTDANLKQLIAVSQRHGPVAADDWIAQAASRGVKTTQLARYVHGIIRTINREKV